MGGLKQAAPRQATYHVYVDEHGSIGNDVSDDCFGFGCVIVQPRDEESLCLRVRKRFPNGLHMREKTGAGKRRAAREVAQILSDFPRCFGGGQGYPDPAYARSYWNEIVQVLPPEHLLDLVNAAPIGASGIVNPQAASAPLLPYGRLCATYFAALRLPIVALMRLPSTPDPFTVLVRVGVVGEPEAFHRKLSMIARPLADGLSKNAPRYVSGGLVPPTGCDVAVETIERPDDPLFDLADVFAHIAHHLTRQSKLGRQLHDILFPVLERLPWPNAESIRHGFTIIHRSGCPPQP